MKETPEIVAERYDLHRQKKNLERRLDEIDAVLKLRTGQRQVGEFMVDVCSFTRTVIDGDAVRETLGDATPMKATVAVRLTVVPA